MAVLKEWPNHQAAALPVAAKHPAKMWERRSSHPCVIKRCRVAAQPAACEAADEAHQTVAGQR